MKKPAIEPYGSWRSPLTSDIVVSKTMRIDQILMDGQNVTWLESRPLQQGRHVLVRCPRPDTKAWVSLVSSAVTPIATELTPPPFDVRSRAQEYGGGAYLVDRDTIYFSHRSDGRLYRQTPDSAPEPITPEGNRRYADLMLDHHRNRLICVSEEHPATGEEAITSLVSIPLQPGDEIQTLVSGNDFTAFPRLSPDGTRLAWITWNHPNMPWDGTELWVGTIQADGTIGEREKVAGGEDESIVQPEWSPDNTLYFVSDRTNWWNLYRWRDGQDEALHPKAAEFSAPLWRFGQSNYAFDSAERIVCTYVEEGIWHLALLDTRTGGLTEIPTPYTSLTSIQVQDGVVACIAGSATLPASVVAIDLATQAITTLRRSIDFTLEPDYLSKPEAITFPTKDDQQAYAFYYPPTNPDFQAPPDTLPPLIVLSHGGPTDAASIQLELTLNLPQYWTSRGFAVVDVNYGGSTGYGRAYRQRLAGQWGVVDVEDCVRAARFLAERKVVDPERLAIRGGSAGGYTTLCALTFYRDFRAGASYFGVSDLEALAQDTHKFESRYLDRLVGPYLASRALYRERSPIHHIDRLSCPVIFFQGMEDRIVPPAQTEAMAEGLRNKSLPVECLLFPGEGHGFQHAATMKRCLEAELTFYSRIFGFTPADTLTPNPSPW